MSDWREEQVVNETRSREINEWIDESNEEDSGDVSSPFLCECSDGACDSTIALTHLEYEEVRAHGTYFAIATDHESPDLDLMVSERFGFAIIRKLPGMPARLATASDPPGGRERSEAHAEDEDVSPEQRASGARRRGVDESVAEHAGALPDTDLRPVRATHDLRAGRPGRGLVHVHRVRPLRLTEKQQDRRQFAARNAPTRCVRWLSGRPQSGCTGGDRGRVGDRERRVRRQRPCPLRPSEVRQRLGDLAWAGDGRADSIRSRSDAAPISVRNAVLSARASVVSSSSGRTWAMSAAQNA